jgi:tRNA dimethylallyltransferase
MIAIFGPTAAGKTGVAVEVARLLRKDGLDPVAVNCDAIQVYRGLEVLSGAATAEEQSQLEHRLVGFVDANQEFSAGRYAELAHAEIDSLLASGRVPIVVGGAGLYLRAALSELELRPPVPAEIRASVEAEMAERGPEAMHAELAPDVAATVHPNDRKRIGRSLELQRAGIEPPTGSEQLWTEKLRHPTELVGLTIDRDRLTERIDARVEAMAAAGAAEEARAADAAGASRTARSAIGFEAFLAGDLEAVKTAQRQYARRQLTWMRKMRNVRIVDRSGLTDADTAAKILRPPSPSALGLRKQNVS